MGVYVLVGELRGEPEIPDADPPADDVLEALITRAEDQIDEWLGAWPTQDAGPSAGRKIVQADIDPWRWAQLQRATRRLAVAFYLTPDVLKPPAYGKVSGPDFSKEQPTAAARRIPDVTVPLNASGLRQLSARVTP